MVRQNSDAVCEGLRHALRQFLASRPDVGLVDLTMHSTLSESTARNFLSGHCPGGREVVGQLQRVLDLAKCGEILQPGANRDAMVISEDHTSRVRRVAKVQSRFYQTQTVKRVAEVLAYCAEKCTIGIVTGAFGVGKTEAVAAWRRGDGRKTESNVFEFDEYSSSNKIDFAACLARMFGQEASGGSANGGRVFREVCEYLRTNPCLMVFDQVETLRPRIFQVIRQLHDRTHEYGVGVVLLSAPVLLARMNNARIADLGALTSRVGIWAPLSGVSKAEMAAIVKQEGITDVDESAFDLWWRATAGSMRRLMRAIDLLRSKHAGKRITEKTVAGVAGHLWGMNLATAVA